VRPSVQTIYRALPARRRRALWLLPLLMIAGGLAEILSIGAVLPFLVVLTDPAKLEALPFAADLLALVPGGSDPALAATILFIALFLLAAAVRLALNWYGYALAFNIAYDLAVRGFRRLIRQPYTFYTGASSAAAVSQFEKIYLVAYGVLLGGVLAVSASLMAGMMILFLLAINPLIAVLSGVVLIGTYALVTIAARKPLRINSQVIAEGSELRVRQVQEAVGGIRDILIDRSQPVFEAGYQRTAGRLCRALTVNNYVASAPRIVVEAVGMLFIGILALSVSRTQGGLVGALPTLGAFVLGAQRLLPLLQQAYLGWSHFVGHLDSLDDVARLLELPEGELHRPSQGEPFRSEIVFRGVGFGYLPGRPVVEDLDLAVKRGERIGIVGPTGSGKSTLMDLLLGLLEPTSGTVLVDGKTLAGARRAWWQAQVAHVPQSIYLSDDSLGMNIAFGQPPEKVDWDRVRDAARQAGLDDFIASLPEGLRTRCGERGVRLSGGQRQRIGIARALYKKASVLVFDEATSALDTATERAIMAAIDDLAADITVVQIAHRLTTLRNCDRIFCLEKGRLVRTVSSVAELGAVESR
jgi:ATP-binding cassette, subfamily B, bacterial PglK